MNEPERASRILTAFLFLVSMLTLAIWGVTGIGVKPRELLGLLGVVAALLALSAFYTRLRPDPGIARLSRALAELTILTFMVGSLSYNGAALAMPLRDDWLQAVDTALGFDWRAWLVLLDGYPSVNTLLVVVYHSMLPQTVVVAVALVAVRAYAHLDRYLLAYGLAALATVAIAAAMPALGPLIHLGIPASDHANITIAFPMEAQEQAQALREGRLKMIDLSGAQGLVTFPSFHTVSAVILTLAFAGVPFLRWAGMALNALMLVSIPIEGNHYLVDVIAGGVVALAAWRAAGWLLRREAKAAAWDRRVTALGLSPS